MIMKTGLAFTLLVFMAACQAVPVESPEPVFPPAEAIVEPMPPDGFMDQWQKDGPARRFTGADLYGHINGGAEVFLELGFEHVEVQRYRGTAGEVVVEQYAMTDPGAALGVYLLHCGKEERHPSIAARHTASRYQVQFVRGSAYIKVNNPEGDPDVGAVLPRFAAYMAELLPGESTERFFTALPDAGRIPGSERVIRGPYTLERIYLLGPGDILQLEGTITALAASYKDEGGQRFSRIFADYDSPQKAVAALGHLNANLDPYLEVVSADDRCLIFKDYAGKFGKIEIDGSRLNAAVLLNDLP